MNFIEKWRMRKSTSLLPYRARDAQQTRERLALKMHQYEQYSQQKVGSPQGTNGKKTLREVV